MKKIILQFCLAFICISVYAIKPQKEFVAKPSDMNLVYEEVFVRTSTGDSILSWHILANEDTNQPQKNVSLIISYGDWGNMSQWIAYGGSLAMNGYDVWLYDYRGFGASASFEIDSSVLYYPIFEEDLSAVVEYVKKASTRKVCLLGLSMGSIISTNYMIEHPEAIDFYIGDGHIYSPEKAKARLVQAGKNIQIEKREKDLNYDKFYQENTIPMLIFSAKYDLICPKEDMETVCKTNKNIHIQEFECGHLQCFFSFPEVYITKIDDFLKKYNL